jgi:hypothetical protein
MNTTNPKEILAYWIEEREWVRRSKEQDCPKPWSDDAIFQTTYFCNVRREDDRVTRWIRTHWSPDALGWDDYEYAMVVARFLNWPDTLHRLATYTFDFDTDKHVKKYDLRPERIYQVMQDVAQEGQKVWGNAYVVTSHGLAMPKARYLCERVLPAAYDLLGAGRWRCQYGVGPYTLARRHDQLMRLEGLGSFMAAQVIADLKNTKDHPLYTADDWYSWSAPGPGSLRGLAWFFEEKISPKEYDSAIQDVKDYLLIHHPKAAIHLLDGEPEINMQDLQNCLCEFDKYMRVKTGKGRSKRGYPGK